MSLQQLSVEVDSGVYRLVLNVRSHQTHCGVKLNVQSTISGRKKAHCGEFDQTFIGPVKLISKLLNIYPVRDIQSSA
jgi:hypothetical protein